MSRLSTTPKRLSDRISMFEQTNSSVSSSTSSITTSGGTRHQQLHQTSSSSSVTRTLSTKNFDALRGQFDSNNKSITAVESPSTPPAAKSVVSVKAAEPATPTTTGKQTITISANNSRKGSSPTVVALSKSPSGKTAPGSSPRKTPLQKTGSNASVGGRASPSPRGGSNGRVVSAKSLSSPIRPSPATGVNINTVTINVKKTTMTDVGNGNTTSHTTTKVVRDKAVTAPIVVPQVMVTVDAAASGTMKSTKNFSVVAEEEEEMEYDENKSNNSSSRSAAANRNGNGGLSPHTALAAKNGRSGSLQLNNNNHVQEEKSVSSSSVSSVSSAMTRKNKRDSINNARNNNNSNENMKLDLEYKDEKIIALSKELEELSAGGATDEEVSALKRQKNELEMRLRDQEEELDDLAGQVQLLESSKTKLEMSLAALKKEHRRELSAKEDELEDGRAAAQKKVKALEQQLESEHEERIAFVREKHELETKIMTLTDMASRSADEEQVTKLRKDLKRTKALLRDANLMLERSKSEGSNKALIRQLKNQLEESDHARTAALKGKQGAEMELGDVQAQLDDVLRTKAEVEDRLYRLGREKADAQSQVEDNEEQLSEVIKKYKAAVAQLSVDQITIHEQCNAITDLEEERNGLKETLAEYTQKIQSLEGENVSTAQHHRLELKIKELESKLDLEQTTRSRMETQINRLKEGIEKLNGDCEKSMSKEQSAQELIRKLQRQLRDLREEFATLQSKETETNAKKNELEKQLELSEAEVVTAKSDVKLAMKRIEDLQTAISGDIDSETDSINSDIDSDSSDDEFYGAPSAGGNSSRYRSGSRTLDTMMEESVDEDAPGGDKDAAASSSGRSSPRKVSHQSLDGAARQEDESNA